MQSTVSRLRELMENLKINYILSSMVKEMFSSSSGETHIWCAISRAIQSLTSLSQRCGLGTMPALVQAVNKTVCEHTWSCSEYFVFNMAASSHLC